MNKRILISIGVIVVVGSLGFWATQAFFTDTETGTGSEFTVGTLDLEVGGANGTEVEAFAIDNIGAEGNIAGGHTWTVNNAGSLPGRLYFKLGNLVNNENGCNEPEQEVDDTCDDPGADQGELGGVITVDVSLDGAKQMESTLATADQDVIGGAWNALTPVEIPAGGSVTVSMDWATGQDEYGNEIQSDSLTFDTVFDLVQIVEPSPTP